MTPSAGMISQSNTFAIEADDFTDMSPFAELSTNEEPSGWRVLSQERGVPFFGDPGNSL